MGKTNLLHAVGNGIMARKANTKVVYMHSERFVQDMVKVLQNNAIEEFKHYYRSVDALLIDDIQFFANKERSQEEFFHTFNALLEGQSADYSDLRSLSQGNKQRRRPVEVAFWLVADGGN